MSDWKICKLKSVEVRFGEFCDMNNTNLTCHDLSEVEY